MYLRMEPDGEPNWDNVSLRMLREVSESIDTGEDEENPLSNSEKMQAFLEDLKQILNSRN